MNSFTAASLLAERNRKAQEELGHMAEPQDGALHFIGSYVNGWLVYDSGENLCGEIYLRSKWAWFEASKERQPMSLHEVKALASFMGDKEAEAK